MASSLFVLGGARSGKSRYAIDENRARTRVTFIATAEARDVDMAARIARHRAERPSHWHTVEAPHDLVSRLRACCAEADAVVVDCLTLWVSNLMAEKRDIDAEVQGLAGTLKIAAGPVIFVSNEVGLGIVPDNELARTFRDNLGRANQTIAAAADCVLLMVAGIPLPIKGEVPR